MTTDVLAVEETNQWDPAVVALGKIIMGVGLVGIVLWLSPYTLTDLLMTFGIPLLIIALLLFGIGLSGSGFLDTINKGDIGARTQEYLRHMKANPQ